MTIKRFFPFMLFLIIWGCTRSEKESDYAYSQLQRIDHLLNQRIEKLSDDFLRAFATNRDLTRTQFIKSEYLSDLINETISIISSDSILLKNKISINEFIESFESALDNIKIEGEVMDTLKKRHINYWSDQELSSPLSKEQSASIIIDIKTFQYDLLNYLFHQITSNDFNFNVLKPIVIESSNTIKSGEIYEAKICFTAFDTTRNPDILIGDSHLPVINGYGIYRYQSHNPGKKTISGKMIFQRNNYELDTILFEHSFYIK